MSGFVLAAYVAFNLIGVIGCTWPFWWKCWEESEDPAPEEW